MIDSNAREFSLMSEAITAFNSSRLTIGDLVSRLENLLNATKDLDEQWQKKFLKHWGMLEDIYANALDKGFPKIPNEHMTLVQSAIQEINTLIEQELKKSV